MLLAIVGEEVGPASKGNRPISEIPVSLFEGLLNRIDGWDGTWVACMDFIRGSSYNRSIFLM